MVENGTAPPRVEAARCIRLDGVRLWTD